MSQNFAFQGKDRTIDIDTYLHDELVKDKEKIGLITHECSCDVFVVGWIELLLRRL